jgi:hypothetical protein
MALNVRIKDVVSPRSLDTLTIRRGGNFQTFADERVLQVYTGWVAATHGAGGSLTRNIANSFVPLDGNRRVQTFLPGNVDLGDVEITVTAALSSFGDAPSVAAVDRASVTLEPQTIGGVGGNPLALVIQATLAAHEGNVHAFSYQVTVLAHPRLFGDILTLSPQETPDIS